MDIITDDGPMTTATLADEVHLHNRLLFRIAFRVVRNAAAAEDVCQQAVAKAWEHRDDLRGRGRLRAWLVRVVLNESITLQRRRSCEYRVLSLHAATTRASEEPEKQSDLRQAVIEALAELPEPTRTIVALRLMEGWTGNQVKEHLGFSASEVSRRLHEGMAQLRESLAEHRPVSQEG